MSAEKRVNNVNVKWARRVAAATVVMAGVLSATVQAADVAYWRFENTAVSDVNSPTLDYTAGSTAGFSTDVAGAVINDPVAATNVANVGSYDHGAGTASIISDASGLMNAAVTDGSSFTVEAFVKFTVGGNQAFDRIIGNIDGSDGWGIGFDGSSKLRFFGRNFVTATTTSFVALISPNELSEGVWHHIAAVGTFSTGVDGDQVVVQLYEDYVAVGGTQAYTGIGAGNPVISPNTADYVLGANNPFTGLIDELRISDQALAPNQFLNVVVPEPASLSLLGLGALLLTRRHRLT